MPWGTKHKTLLHHGDCRQDDPRLAALIFDRVPGQLLVCLFSVVFSDCMPFFLLQSFWRSLAYLSCLFPCSCFGTLEAFKTRGSPHSKSSVHTHTHTPRLDQSFFPTCQVRVVRFYVSCLAAPLLLASSPRLVLLNCEWRMAAFPAGPQPQV